MGDGGWRRIDAAAARHILTLLGSSARASGRIGGVLLGPIRKGGASSAPPFPFTNPLCLGGVSAARSRSAR